MWQETKHGLYKQFSFQDFREAWEFMQRIALVLEKIDHYPRIQNERNLVDIWINTHDQAITVTDLDRELANTIDTLATASNNDNVAAIVDKETTNLTEIQLYADGGSRGNPGPSASGYVLLDMAGRIVLKQG